MVDNNELEVFAMAECLDKEAEKSRDLFEAGLITWLELNQSMNEEGFYRQRIRTGSSYHVFYDGSHTLAVKRTDCSNVML